MALILDTSVLLAALDRDDADHGPCARLIERATESLVVPSPVLVELDYWVTSRLGLTVFQKVLEDIDAGLFLVENLAAEDYRRVHAVRDQYHDADVGFVDASILAVCERLDETKLATLDARHFRMLRPRHTESLTLLPDDS